MDQRQVQYLLPLLLTFAGPWLTRHGVSDATATQWVNATLAYFTNYVVPAASWAYTFWISRRKSRLQAASTIPGVEKIVMSTQAGADAAAQKDATGMPVSDKILGPAEDLSHVAAQPGVVAVVVQNSAQAAANPSSKVIGAAAVPEVAKAVAGAGAGG